MLIHSVFSFSFFCFFSNSINMEIALRTDSEWDHVSKFNKKNIYIQRKNNARTHSISITAAAFVETGLFSEFNNKYFCWPSSLSTGNFYFILLLFLLNKLTHLPKCVCVCVAYTSTSAQSIESISQRTIFIFSCIVYNFPPNILLLYLRLKCWWRMKMMMMPSMSILLGAH